MASYNSGFLRVENLIEGLAPDKYPVSKREVTRITRVAEYLRVNAPSYNYARHLQATLITIELMHHLVSTK